MTCDPRGQKSYLRWPYLKFTIVFVIVLVTNCFECLVKMFDISFVQVVWSQISSTSKPPSFSIFFFRLHNLINKNNDLGIKIRVYNMGTFNNYVHRQYFGLF